MAEETQNGRGERKVAWIEQLKNIFKANEGGGTSKFRSKILLLLILGVCLILFNSLFSSGQRDADPLDYTPEPADEKGFEEYSGRELTAMLNQIRGVSNARIFIALEDSGKIEIARDQEQSKRVTIEEDSGGGSREISEDTLRESHVITRDAQGRETPLIVQEIAPRYRGVLVVADGVENPVVQSLVVEAVRSALGLPYHRITVLPRGE